MMAEREWVSGADRLAEIVEELAEAPAYALDTEFHRERTYYPHLALLQLAWPGGLALVDPLAVDIGPLASVFAGAGVAVLHAADQDLEVLLRACGAVPSRLFDTQLAAGFIGLSSPSLVNLVERILGTRLPKGDRLTDWTRRPLTEDQQEYAAADVVYLLEVRESLCSQLDGSGRLAWAEQECAELLRRARQPQDPETAWWRLKESRQMRGRSRSVAQALGAWRERRAARLDIPPRFVLPDLAMVSMAQRPPRSRDDLSSVRGLDGRFLKDGGGAEILDAIELGQTLEEDSLRLPPTDDIDRRLRPAVALVSAWIAQLSSDLHIDAALLATRADLNSFLRGDEGARLANGWRHELVGAPVHKVVSGAAALAFDGKGGLLLEARSYDIVSRTAPGPETVPE